MLGLIYALPIPASNPSDTTYEGFKEIASGRTILSNEGTPFKPGLEQVCAENCKADFTCNAFSIWMQSGDYECLKLTKKPNPWMTIPQYISNKTHAKIYIKSD